MLEKLAEDSDVSVRSNVARNANTPLSLLEKLARDSDGSVRNVIAQNADIPLSWLEKLARDSDESVRGGAAQNANTPLSLLEKLAEDSDYWVRGCVARNVNTPPSALEKLAEDSDDDVRRDIARNANTPLPALEKLAEDSNRYARAGVALNANVSDSALHKLFEDKDGHVRNCFTKKNDWSFNQLVKLAVYVVSDDEIWIRNAEDIRGGEKIKSPTGTSTTMTKADARKIKSAIQKQMSTIVSEIRSQLAWSSMERWTLKQTFDLIKTERNLVDEVLQDYDSELFACSKADFKNLCEEVFAKLSLKYS